jgi:hypothetical protein
MTKLAEPSTPSGSSTTTMKATDHELQKHDNFTRYRHLERLDKLRSRGRHVGWGVQDELNSLWYAAALDEHQSE